MSPDLSPQDLKAVSRKRPPYKALLHPVLGKEHEMRKIASNLIYSFLIIYAVHQNLVSNIYSNLKDEINNKIKIPYFL